jgi:hypothetical protein
MQTKRENSVINNMNTNWIHGYKPMKPNALKNTIDVCVFSHKTKINLFLKHPNNLLFIGKKFTKIQF